MRGFKCFSGLKEEGIAIINEREGLEIPKIKPKQKVFTVPATEIALKTIGRPLANTTLLGAFAAATAEFDLDALIEAIKHRFSGKAQEGNLRAVKEGFAFIKDKFKE
jgi:pyruvate ferredoxin oxidoreductase gamma subunit